MTINQYRKHIKENPVQCFGMNFKMLEQDIVRIRTEKDTYEIKYTNFIDLNNSLSLSDKIKELEITDILVRKHELSPHTVVLVLDTISKDREDSTSNGIKANMKYI